MSKKEFLFVSVKSDPDIEYLSADNNSKTTDELIYNKSEIKLENDIETLYIKQEDNMDIKDEIQTADDNQDVESVHLTHTIQTFANSKKPNQEHDQTKKLFACTLCEFKATSRSRLIFHTRIHPKTLFDCNLCEYKTISKHQLTLHSRTHTGEKPFACKVCEFKSSRKSNLKVHERIHTGEKPYACNRCELKFTHKCNLIKHTWTHTQEKSFVCSMCEFTSSQERSWIIHQRIHRVKKPLARILPRMSV